MVQQHPLKYIFKMSPLLRIDIVDQQYPFPFILTNLLSRFNLTDFRFAQCHLKILKMTSDQNHSPPLFLTSVWNCKREFQVWGARGHLSIAAGSYNVDCEYSCCIHNTADVLSRIVLLTCGHCTSMERTKQQNLKQKVPQT